MDTNSIIKCIKNNEISKIAKGSVKEVYKMNSKEVIKIPRYTILFSENIKEKKNTYYKRYNCYLSGVNQILNEILIWNKEKSDLLCPITSYYIDKNTAFSISPKIATAGNIIQDEEFDLKFFCDKLNVSYWRLKQKIWHLSGKYDLDKEDLFYNENNFGIDLTSKKIVLIDYGFKKNFDYKDIEALEQENQRLGGIINDFNKWKV